MVFLVAGVIVLPIIMMMVLGPPPEHLFAEESEDTVPENIGSLFFAFFVMWIIWILIMIRVVIQKRKGSFGITKI